MHEDARPPIQEGRALTRTCIVDTPYALGLYLLKTELADYARTRFYIDQFMPEEIAARLPNARRMLVRGVDVRARLRAGALRLMCFYEHFRTVRHTRIFAQDHISCASRLIGGCQYTLIEDAPGIYSRIDAIGGFRRGGPRGAAARVWSRLVRGSVFGHECGRSPQCVNRWVSQRSDMSAPPLAGRRAELVDVAALWGAASAEKQSEILRIFCGGRDPRDEVGATCSCSTLVLTQPLMEDFGLSEAEMRAVYAPLVDRYAADGGVAVKSHPRDGFRFVENFPQVKPVDTLLPVQFLLLFGMRFRRVVTVSSSSAFAFPPSVEVVRIDVSGDSRLAVLGGVR